MNQHDCGNTNEDAILKIKPTSAQPNSVLFCTNTSHNNLLYHHHPFHLTFLSNLLPIKMGFKSTFMQLALVLPSLLIVSSSPVEGRRAPPHERDFQGLADNYLSLWGGKLSLVDSVIHPKISLIADRLPSSVGSDVIQVGNIDEYVAFVQKSRDGWKKYNFDVIHMVGNGNQMAIRWKMNGITSANMTLPT